VTNRAKLKNLPLLKITVTRGTEWLIATHLENMEVDIFFCT